MKGMTESKEMESGKIKQAFMAAFPVTIPIFAGFWFVAFAYGVYMNSEGFSFLYPTIMAAVIFGGSLEFLVVSMLLSPFAPIEALTVALMVQARHLFYGIAMLEKYRGAGWKKTFLIFMMCDETFALNYATTIPRGVDKYWYMFFISLLNYLYWVTGALVGGLLGSVITFNLKGLGFVMTTMFVVIFLEQFMKEKSHITAIVGGAASLLCLALLGPDSFMIPAMVIIVGILTIFRKPVEKAGGYDV